MRFVKVLIFGALLTVVCMLCGCGDGCHKEHWGPWLETVFSGEDAILFQRSSGWNQYCNTVIASGSEDEYSKYEYFLALSWEDSVRNVTEPYEEWHGLSARRWIPYVVDGDRAIAIQDNDISFVTWQWLWTNGTVKQIGEPWGQEWLGYSRGHIANLLFQSKGFAENGMMFVSLSGGHKRNDGWPPLFYVQNLETGAMSSIDSAFGVDTRSWNDFLVVDSVLYGVAILSRDTGVVYRIDGSIRDSVFLDLAALGYADAVKFQVEDLTAALFKETDGNVGLRFFEPNRGGKLSAQKLSVIEWGQSVFILGRKTMFPAATYEVLDDETVRVMGMSDTTTMRSRWWEWE